MLLLFSGKNRKIYIVLVPTHKTKKMSIDDKVSEKGKFALSSILETVSAIGGATLGAVIGSAFGPIGTAVGTYSGDFIGHILGFGVPWYIQHANKGISENIRDLSGIYKRKIIPFLLHPLAGGAIAFGLSSFYPSLPPALVGMAGSVGSELLYHGASYLGNLSRLEGKSTNESYKKPNTIPYPQQEYSKSRAA